VAVAAGGSSGESSVQSYSFTNREWLDFRIVQRSSLEPGAELSGPAILLEETATTYLDAGFTATAHESGSLFIHDQGVVTNGSR
jgi:N-methylhydantoinase A